MAGLRERQKAARERRILEAASTQFRKSGYRAAKIEDIAEAAEVSVGTIYNYYQTKGDILIATVAMEDQEVIAAGARILEHPPERVGAALLALIYQYYDSSLKYLSKEMWRLAIAHSIENPLCPSGQRYAELDRQLAKQVTDLIRVLQHRGDIDPDLDVGSLGQLIFSAINQAFIGFVKVDDMTLHDLHALIASQIEPLATQIEADVGTQ
ncbi:TetR/AcrR family transcriptional regulator [Ruegeria halocynthiae]|uniref:TetR/AcrR family transcriptional regulator n=1 Tax=Ruegeria halocynthiae TaxID=985054 RepID=UPI000567BF4F|nr:TetR/AcrR family transcriptional regulator [Ruegeria halocynthiae]